MTFRIPTNLEEPQEEQVSKVQILTKTFKGQPLEFISAEANIHKANRAFITIGKALTVIQDNQFYLLRGFKSVPDYCEAIFDYKKSYCNKIIRAYLVYTLLADNEFPSLPVIEAQCRPLAALLEETREEADVLTVWETLCAMGGRITAKSIQAEIDRYCEPETPAGTIVPKIGEPEEAPRETGKTPVVENGAAVSKSELTAENNLLKAQLMQTELKLQAATQGAGETLPVTDLARALFQAGYDALLDTISDAQGEELEDLYNELMQEGA